MRALERAALAAAALLCFIPFVVGTHANIIPTFYAEWTALALGIAVIALALARRGDVRVPWIALGLFAFLLVLVLQLVLGRVAFPERSAIAILYAAWAALLAVAAAQLRERVGLECVAAWLQGALAAAGFLIALTGFMQRYGLEAFGLRIFTAQGAGRFLGVTGQQNHLANLVAVGLVSLAFLAAARRVSLATAALAAAPMLLALPLAGSRSVYVYALLALGAAALAIARGDAGARRPAAILGVAFAVLLIAQLFTHGASGARVAQSLASGSLDPGRVLQARYAWAIFLAHPWLGAGWSELAWNAFQIAPAIGAAEGNVASHHAHNLALQLLAETGIAGALPVLCALALWFARFPWRAPSAAECWLLAIAAIELFHGLVEYPQWYAYFLGLFALVLGLAGGGIRIPERSSRPLRLALVGALAAGAIALGSALTDYRALER